MKNIVSFSGGKDSTAMLLMMIEKGVQIDRIINIDTTKEFPQMYEHIEKVQEYINPYGLKIETVKIPFNYWFFEHKKTKGKYIDFNGYGWPDFKFRWCTAAKRRSFRDAVYGGNKVKHYKNKDIMEYHGIAFDEPHRNHFKDDFKNIKIKRPLISWQITEEQALQYCYDKGFDWGGLYEKMARVSCWCCPLSRIGELKVLYTDFTELWQELKEMDKKSFRQFRSDYSVEDLELKFKKELKC